MAPISKRDEELIKEINELGRTLGPGDNSDLPEYIPIPEAEGETMAVMIGGGFARSFKVTDGEAQPRRSSSKWKGRVRGLWSKRHPRRRP